MITAAGPVPWPADWIRLVLCYGAFGFGDIIPATFLLAMAREVMDDPLLSGGPGRSSASRPCSSPWRPGRPAGPSATGGSGR